VQGWIEVRQLELGPNGWDLFLAEIVGKSDQHIRAQVSDILALLGLKITAA
jgi:hypothetical protein